MEESKWDRKLNDGICKYCKKLDIDCKCKDKFILDACCSGRMMWFNKKHPKALYIDKRDEDKGFIEDVPNFKIKPDIVMDFRKMDLPDKSFKLVVFDPPHLKNCGPNSILGKKFGCLHAETWQSDLKKGFNECWRVLEDYGVLIFKWNDHDIKIKTLLQLLPEDPLFYNISSGSKIKAASKTFWFCFMKIPKNDVRNAKG